VKGSVKEKVGRATNSPRLAAEGRIEKIGGRVQKKIDQVEKTLGVQQERLRSTWAEPLS
jgi:uncharacterized protein YjbJ (UPF0337 family)